DEALLDFAGGVEFGAELIALAPGAECAADEHGGDGQVDEHEAELEEVESEGTEREALRVAEDAEGDDDLEDALRNGDGAIASGADHLANANGKEDGVEG